MIAEHQAGAAGVDQLAHPAQNRQVVGPPVDQIADQPQLEARAVGVARAAQQLLQLLGAALHVPDEDRLHRLNG